MSNCVMCKGEGRIPQRGAETSGSREVCPTCNGTGVMPEGKTEATHVYNAPQTAPEQPAGEGRTAEEAETAAQADGSVPKAEGAPEASTDSSSGSESGAPNADGTAPIE